jgi:type VI secretion system protein ImpC
VLISERREFELAEQGFIALTMRKNTDNAAFFSANSCQKPKFFGNDKEGKEAELNYKLGTQLPYILWSTAWPITSRSSSAKTSAPGKSAATWSGTQHLDSPVRGRPWITPPPVCSRRPLRQADITVSDVDGDPGWYRVGLKVRPHFKYMGASFTLSLVGKLDKS